MIVLWPQMEDFQRTPIMIRAGVMLYQARVQTIRNQRFQVRWAGKDGTLIQKELKANLKDILSITYTDEVIVLHHTGERAP